MPSIEVVRATKARSTDVEKKEQEMKTISLSSKSKAAADALFELYKAGKVFAGKKDPEVQRNPEVYLAACALADEIGKDLAKHVKGKASGQGCYEILHNMKAILRRRVGPGRCAVGIYDFETKTCSYAGIVSC